MRIKLLLATSLILLVILGAAACTAAREIRLAVEHQVQAEMRMGVGEIIAQTRRPVTVEALRKAIKARHWGSTGYFWLLDKTGKLVDTTSLQSIVNPYLLLQDTKETFSAASTALAAGRPFEAQLGSGDVVRLAVAVSAPGGAIVGLTVPRREYAGAIDARRRAALTAMSAAAAAGLILLSLVIGWIAKPLLQLRDNALRIVAGDLAPVQELPGGDELAELSRGLARMQTAVAEGQRSLDCNRLTGLPGHNALQQILFDRIDRKTPFAVILSDVNHLSAYNQAYGFERGDSIIRLTATMLTNAVKELGGKEDVVTNINGDRFVIVTTPDKADAICRKIIELFDRDIPQYYDEDDRARGSLLCKDRRGNIVTAGLMTICMGVATNVHRPLIHPLQIGQITGELRDYLKQTSASGYLIDRRTTDRADAAGLSPVERDAPQEPGTPGPNL